jgi:tetratricopeptide (TPR) repeat protein
MGANFERAQLLFEQSRYEPCERALRQELAEEPGNPMAHALLGLCLAAMHREGALESAREAIRQAPDLAFAYYALADILHDREDLSGAGEAIREAIGLDPMMPNYHALQAGIEFKQGHWAEALAAAERGLAIDAEHVGCTNLRALALVKLRRTKEAGQAFESALARDPDNAVTHANQGWALLEQGATGRALYHLREALRLDADFEMARQGVIEAFKARYFVYQLLLRFVFWMSRLSHRRQWAILLGGTVGYLVIEVVAFFSHNLELYIRPVQALCILFAVLTWIADPLFNLVLRFDRVGRSSLSAAQVRASNMVGACLLGAAVALLAWLCRGWVIALDLAGLYVVLLLPVVGIADCPPGWRRRLMFVYTQALVIAGGVGLILLAHSGHGALETYKSLMQQNNQMDATARHGLLLTMLFVIGSFLSPWLVLLLLHSKPRP